MSISNINNLDHWVNPLIIQFEEAVIQQNTEAGMTVWNSDLPLEIWTKIFIEINRKESFVKLSEADKRRFLLSRQIWFPLLSQSPIAQNICIYNADFLGTLKKCFIAKGWIEIINYKRENKDLLVNFSIPNQFSNIEKSANGLFCFLEKFRNLYIKCIENEVNFDLKGQSNERINLFCRKIEFKVSCQFNSLICFDNSKHAEKNYKKINLNLVECSDKIKKDLSDALIFHKSKIHAESFINYCLGTASSILGKAPIFIFEKTIDSITKYHPGFEIISINFFRNCISRNHNQKLDKLVMEYDPNSMSFKKMRECALEEKGGALLKTKLERLKEKENELDAAYNKHAEVMKREGREIELSFDQSYYHQKRELKEQCDSISEDLADLDEKNCSNLLRIRSFFQELCYPVTEENWKERYGKMWEFYRT